MQIVYMQTIRLAKELYASLASGQDDPHSDRGPGITTLDHAYLTPFIEVTKLFGEDGVLFCTLLL